MLQIIVEPKELYDEKTETFVYTKETCLKLEHSLLSISKWESKWCKPFLPKNRQDQRTPREMLDYIKCMTLNSNISDHVYSALTKEQMDKIFNYINHPMTATTVSSRQNSPMNREIITSELIYYWMIAYNIPFECEKWHINRLIMLIRVCAAKNKPDKMSKADLIAHNRALNSARRKALHTKG
jgi:hypothetical protein